MKTLISLFALVMFAAVSIANDCRQRVVVHHQQAQVAQHAAVQQYAVQNHVQNYAAAYVAQYVAVPLVIPAYTVSYTKDSSDELSKLREELKAIREALKTQPTPPMQPADGPITVPLTQRKQAQQVDHDGAKILVVSCSKCHDASNAKNKGGGFVVTNGASLAPLSDSQTLAVIISLYSGAMPKGSKMSDADVGAVIEWASLRK